MIKDKNPISRVDEIVGRLQGAIHFFPLDILSGYYQIRVRDENVPNTCIRTWFGSFEFLVMPFGVTNAPSIFQDLINSVFRDLEDVYAMCYLDDIISDSESDYRDHVTEVLRRSCQEKVFFKKSKCHFNQTLVRFLGHVIGAEGLTKQRNKVAAAMEWPSLRTKSNCSRSWTC
jgi:hypothetical protein